MKSILPVLLVAAGLIQAAAEPTAGPVREIVFASCFKESMVAPALDAAAGLRPELFIWMGDNIYGDSEDVAVLRGKYDAVKAMPAYQKLRGSCVVLGTWDDHDFGKNDAGKEFPMRAESQRVFLDFLDEPTDSPRRAQPGVYAFHDHGPAGKQTRVILLDTRYHRDGIGTDGDVLGEAQWKWLEDTLSKSPARVNLLVSSIQVLASDHRFEKWANFPKERARLLALLARKEIPPVLILTGDRHLAEISVDTVNVGYPLYDVTSSSLNLPLGGTADEVNALRVGKNFRPANFGTLSIDWSRETPVLTACIRDQHGRPQRAVSFELARTAE